MSKRIRHHVNPLSMSYLDFEISPPELSGHFTEVEIGCAEGEFLFERYGDCPDHQVIGLEIRRSLVDEINDKSRNFGLKGISAVFCNVNTHMTELFPAGSVDRFFVNFPDPWFKKDHHKRRIVSPALVADLISCLRSGGEIFFQSDIFDLAMDAMAVFEENGPPQIRNVSGEWSFMKENPFKTMSRRERFVTEEGLRVWRMLYRLSC
ncbi:tRNA (guanosine(46)-N7)-methyltransferase TrmB [Myxococcota bacterium]|nr:tRNA (guanosine(46)-N7)-methyltransferase TrmB [Myxococcota bacterium]MBU1379748.1 tRNA (guanosine(46)-N7)-methyltransferase TrmB [Myxococcota bacterium]MBU1498539.1 tRNA (guanosine(46)-N7)-methyltransferase TrmB [Myxococcota bacterium]